MTNSKYFIKLVQFTCLSNTSILFWHEKVYFNTRFSNSFRALQYFDQKVGNFDFSVKAKDLIEGQSVTKHHIPEMKS